MSSISSCSGDVLLMMNNIITRAKIIPNTITGNMAPVTIQKKKVRTFFVKMTKLPILY